MSEAPAPLTKPDCDLRDFAFMPLDVQRLRDSDLAALESPEACWAAVLLWCVAWHQLPAGSLPDDDRLLARFTGYQRAPKDWQRLRPGALRGWIKCSDGRLYHPVVAEKAKEAWASKLQQRWRTECARIRKANERKDAKTPVPTWEEWMSARQGQDVACDVVAMSRGQAADVAYDTGPPSQGQSCETPSKGQGQGQGQGQGDSPSSLRSEGAAPLSAQDRLYAEGLPVLEELSGKTRDAAAKLLGSWRKLTDDEALLEVLRDAATKRPQHAISWIVAAIKVRGRPPAQALGRSEPTDPLRDGVPEYWDPWDSWGLREWLWRQPGLTTAKRPETGNLHYVLHGADAEEQIGVLLEAANVPAEARPNLDAAGEWLRAGITIKRPAVLEEARAMGQRLGAIRSLKVFDDLVRQAHARRAA